jgi:hypothetical protein
MEMGYDLGANSIIYGSISERIEDEDEVEFELTNPDMLQS